MLEIQPDILHPPVFECEMPACRDGVLRFLSAVRRDAYHRYIPFALDQTTVPVTITLISDDFAADIYSRLFQFFFAFREMTAPIMPAAPNTKYTSAGKITS